MRVTRSELELFRSASSLGPWRSWQVWAIDALVREAKAAVARALAEGVVPSRRPPTAERMPGGPIVPQLSLPGGVEVGDDDA
jgi:hypothetical protein